MNNQTSQTLPSRHELTDSLLHTSVGRVIVGVICGLLAGVFMLGLTVLFTPQGLSSLWWAQLTASIFYGGDAFNFNAAPGVYTAGLCVHFGVSAFCGLIMGKMTKTRSFKKLAIYGLVLGGFCWLATNMFGPDFIMHQGLDSIGQWVRLALYLPFAISLGLLLGLGSRLFSV